MAGSEHADNTNHNPEHVQQGIGVILLEYGTPGKYHRIRGIKSPDEQKRTFRTHPTDQRETENAHQHAEHFDKSNIFKNE